MKRSSFEVAGGPRLRNPHAAVAGRRRRVVAVDVFSPFKAMPDPLRIAPEEAGLLTDFADFMSGGEEAESGPTSILDTGFRERLRRRLWRTFVMGSLRGGSPSTH
jgi:hypothetical protein